MNNSRTYDVLEDLQNKGWQQSSQDFSMRFYDKNDFSTGKTRFPVRTFSSETCTVNSDKPVEITIYFDENCFIAENEKLHIYVTGESVEEATSEFIDQVVHFYYYYSALTEDSVTGYAQTLKEIYCNHFSEDVLSVA